MSMEHPCLTFVMRSPDGSVNLVSQPHMTNKKHMQCKKCPASIIYSRGQRDVTCSRCFNRVKLPKEKHCQKQLECPKCYSEMNLNWIGGLMCQVCLSCNYLTVI